MSRHRKATLAASKHKLNGDDSLSFPAALNFGISDSSFARTYDTPWHIQMPNSKGKDSSTFSASSVPFQSRPLSGSFASAPTAKHSGMTRSAMMLDLGDDA